LSRQENPQIPPMPQILFTGRRSADIREPESV
jgi:hypothetical protein